MAYFDNVPLVDNAGDTHYPQTKTNSVYDINGNRLDNRLSDTPIFGNSGGSIGTAIPTNSETLGGHNASYFEGLTEDVSDRVAVIEGVYPQLSNPNLLINGDFQVWQRGTSFTLGATKAYLADRWCGYRSGFASGLIALKDGRFFKFTNANDSILGSIEQSLESSVVKSLVNKNITISFRVKGSSASLIAVLLVYKNASEFSPGTGADGIIINQTFNVTTGFNTFSVSGTVPDGINGLSVILQFNTINTSYWIDYVKLEVGSVASPFIPRLYAEELMLCQRYYYQLSVGDGWSAFPFVNGAGIFIAVPMLMRTIPLLVQHASGVPQIFNNLSVWQDITVSGITGNNSFAYVFYPVPITNLSQGLSYLVRHLHLLDAEIY